MTKTPSQIARQLEAKTIISRKERIRKVFTTPVGWAFGCVFRLITGTSPKPRNDQRMTMYEDLETVANLKLGEVVERVHRERSTKLSDTIRDLARRGHGHPETGPMVQARINLTHETNEQVCRAVAEIWLDLIRKRNRGRLSRTDVDFIKNKVKACTDAQAQNLAQAIAPVPPTVGPEWIKNEAQRYESGINAHIGRELEIKLREQDVFPPPDVSFWAFIRAFGESWSTKMSGPATVPFTIAALIFPGYPRLIFALLAVTCAVQSSYYLWRRARSA